jgi:hypothetical protein
MERSIRRKVDILDRGQFHINPMRSSRLEKFLQPDCQGVLNPRRASKRTVLLEELVQQGHKVYF